MKGEQFLELVTLVDRLRGPGGCPWDREQTFDTLKPMMLEEAYEVLDAMDSGDRQEFASELGDLLFQVVFLSRVAEDEGSFQIDDVARKIITKMIRRHPHVFGTVNASTADQVLENWENIKRSERTEKQDGNGACSAAPSILEGIPAMPALLTASKLTTKAARVGFDWPNINEIFAKLHEEVDELKEALLETPALKVPGLNRRWETCCSLPSTSRASCASIRKQLYERPIRNSYRAFSTSNIVSGKQARTSARAILRRWSDSGRKRRRRCEPHGQAIH
jgi:MazG family protein